MIRQGEDRALPVVMAHRGACPRRLPSGHVKRYPAEGALLGYYIACPGCGHHSVHVDNEGSFTEVEGALVSCTEPLTCTICDRVLSIAGGVILAVLPKAPPCLPSQLSSTLSSPAASVLSAPSFLTKDELES